MLSGITGITNTLAVRQHSSLADIAVADWNSLTDGSNPFVLHEYLHGLEVHDCLVPQGWQPRHLSVWSDKTLVGAMPWYLRSNSYGEFVFDWAWADAFERAGGRYYPKLVSAIPFAPVRGPRLLVSPDFARANEVKSALISHLLESVRSSSFSSAHILFTEDSEADYLNAGLMPRYTPQFHWYNRNYRDFDDFLDTLVSKKRKQIKRERRQAVEQQIEIEVLNGTAIRDEHWLAYYPFYCSTFHRRWGSPRLTLDFFRQLGERLPDQTLLILARRADTYVAGAFAMLGKHTVYGRHWGCSEQYPFLHFELCYYQTIEFAIKRGLAGVDAGVQGEHKLARGFEPVLAKSFHWIRHAGFRQAIEDYLHREAIEMQQYLSGLEEHLPFRNAEGTHE